MLATADDIHHNCALPLDPEPSVLRKYSARSYRSHSRSLTRDEASLRAMADSPSPSNPSRKLAKHSSPSCSSRLKGPSGPLQSRPPPSSLVSRPSAAADNYREITFGSSTAASSSNHGRLERQPLIQKPPCPRPPVLEAKYDGCQRVDIAFYGSDSSEHNESRALLKAPTSRVNQQDPHGSHDNQRLSPGPDFECAQKLIKASLKPFYSTGDITGREYHRILQRAGKRVSSPNCCVQGFAGSVRLLFFVGIW